jgi:PAS domain S-box-containing protein
MTFRLTRKDQWIVVKIVAVYSLFGALWIYLSDSALGLLVRDPDIITRIATYKGLSFIAVTAALLYYLVGRYIYQLGEYNRRIVSSEGELRSLLELMPVGVAWADDSGAINYINQNFVNKFGYVYADVPTIEAWFLQAYPDAEYRRSVVALWNTHIAEYHNHGTPVPPRDVKIICKDGSIRHVIINAQLSQNRTLAIFTDITERESQQEELIKKQKLESIGVLAGGIAHDFNNILTAILGNISYAGMFIEQNHKAEAPLLQAEKATQRAAELAHQLLTFAKGGQPVTSSVAPRQLIEESLSLVLRGTNVQSRVETAEDLRNIEADSGQISQAFNNLIINAVQAMPGGGVITVQAANVSLDDINNPFTLSPGEYVRFIFTDEGCGIPEEDLKNIFDPYFTTKSSGSGLGLASVLSIVSKHGGHISVTSAIGKGTTFEILLPAGRQPVSSGTARPAKGITDSPNMSVHPPLLVMDDEEMIRDLAAAMLEELGYRVTTCANGAEAVDLYRAAFETGVPFSAVIMDLTIPGGMGGREAARAVLTIDPGARLIVSSGYSNDPIMADYRSYGFGAVVLKPYSVADIARVLETLLNSDSLPE